MLSMNTSGAQGETLMNATFPIGYGRVTSEQVGVFARDGVVKIPSAVDPSWIGPLLDLADQQLAKPSRWVTDSNRGARIERLFTDRYLWRENLLVRRFALESGVAAIAGALMASSSVRFYFDHLLVKQPNTAELTPWHQDIPYWPFLGSQICSVWVALTAATVAESSLEFVRSSHSWERYFAPVPFGTKPAWTADFLGEVCPNVEAARDQYDIVGFDVEAGDALVFSAWTLHAGRGNAGAHRRVALSTRWLGDDAIWTPHPGSDPTVGQADVMVQPGAYPADDDRFPLAWSQGTR
jgi:ectoine hydroxylase-related dioxygenase (phytanoyl-CoA dioxygenase family)